MTFFSQTISFFPVCTRFKGHRQARALFLTALAFTLFLSGCHRQPPQYSSLASSAPFPEPLQQPLESSDPIGVQHHGFQLMFQARYEVQALILSREPYYSLFSKEATLSPLDVVLAWGDLNRPDWLAQQQLSVSQRGRFYYWKTTQDSPMSPAYIATHSANTHLIPANPSIRQQFDRLQPFTRVRLKGYLTHVYLPSSNWSWHTSLTREDVGAGACEIFYITSIQIL